MSKLLLDEHPLLVLPSLAKTIGLNEAIFIQQIHYWMINSKNIYDGRVWTYNSVTQWLDQFPFWSRNTLSRIIENLTKSGLLIIGNYNRDNRDRTKWYSIDYDKLNNISEMHLPTLESKEIAFTQNGEVPHLPKMGEPLPETTPKTSKRTETKEPTAELTLSGQSDTDIDVQLLFEAFYENLKTKGLLPIDAAGKTILFKHGKKHCEEILKIDSIDNALKVCKWAFNDKSFWETNAIMPSQYPKLKASYAKAKRGKVDTSIEDTRKRIERLAAEMKKERGEV